MKAPRIMLPSSCPQNKIMCVHSVEHEEILGIGPYKVRNYDRATCAYHGCVPKYFESQMFDDTFESLEVH
jgi:hypothetical protein